MATSLPFVVLFAILILFLFISHANATGGFNSTSTFSRSPPPPPSQTLHSTSIPPPPPPPTISNDLHENSFSHTALLAPILSHLGFNELSMAAPSLSSDSSTNPWSGPSTIFAPSDSSLHTCLSCSIPNILREHIIPGLYTIDYLRKLAFGTKIETLSPGRCLTVTSTSIENATASATVEKVFIGGVEITHPDLFNNGLIVIHGIQGFVAPLSPYSCDVERLNSLSIPFYMPDRASRQIHNQPLAQPAILRLMLRDAMLRLRNNGFSILSLAIRVKYAELASLNNMTVFALDDVSIFSGSHSYISSVRFHMVPDHFLTATDLEKLPVGATLPTLERGQSLVVTTAGGGGTAAYPMRINYVRIKVPDVIRNLKIVVHSVYLPFPRIHPAAAGFDGILGEDLDGGDHAVVDGACSAVTEEGGSCGGVRMT
ncbi:hypothetical protein P3X46_012835 [Hevea brasiliensis]|uniref:FAS1 domain-containing protein n=1 Tax=Hevea brasiliensis TaxID=3981 RepID=A0ABQ9ME53_HEVBR|nr:fasciclin-like arabinogalactan protein 21 [Hevea brasiliensis]KAJ9177635.1 hypothetical protein P3X46_012835 [Hevea brasiliensis]